MKSFHSKKAEMGVGTLIIFIAMLLVAAIAAGVLIQTAGALQEKALSTGQQAKGQIATNVRIVEVSATDGSSGTLRYFGEIMKLAPGSDAIKIGQAIVTFSTFDTSTTLQYRGNGLLERSHLGFETFSEEDVASYSTTANATLLNDLDEDQLDDYIQLSDASHAVVILSGNGTQVNITVALGGDLSNASGTAVPLAVSNYALNSGGTSYGTISIVGTADTNNTIPANITTIVPENDGTGYFTVEYLQKGSNWVDGNLQRGDVIRVYFEAARQIGEDEDVRLNFIPKIGTATLTQFVTPEVISTERVYLYP